MGMFSMVANQSSESGANSPRPCSSASALALLTCPKYLNPRVPLAWGGTLLGHPTAGMTPGVPGQDEVARDVEQAVPWGPWQCQFGGCHPFIPRGVWGSLSPGQGDAKTGRFGRNRQSQAVAPSSLGRAVALPSQFQGWEHKRCRTQPGHRGSSRSAAAPGSARVPHLPTCWEASAAA